MSLDKGQWLKRVWEKDLSLTIDEKTWEEIISNSEKYIREGRDKFSIKIIQRYYYTPSRLHRGPD